MEISIKANSLKEENMGEESISTKQGLCMMGNGSKIKSLDLVCITISKTKSTREVGLMDKNMAKERIITVTEINILENG